VPEEKEVPMNQEQAGRIADLVLEQIRKKGGMSPHVPLLGKPARIVQHLSIRCVETGQVFDADHKNPAKECAKMGVRNPTFIGHKTEVADVEALLPHHAVHYSDLNPHLED
jgi:hypothetical protein